MNDLIRPALYQAHHEIIPIKQPRQGTPRHTADIVGPVCESGDFFARDRALPNVKPSDLVSSSMPEPTAWPKLQLQHPPTPRRSPRQRHHHSPHSPPRNHPRPPHPRNPAGELTQPAPHLRWQLPFALTPFAPPTLSHPPLSHPPLSHPPQKCHPERSRRVCSRILYPPATIPLSQPTCPSHPKPASATSTSRSPTSTAPSPSTAASSASNSRSAWLLCCLYLRRRLSPPHRPQHLGERRRRTTPTRQHRPLPPRHRLPNPRRPRPGAQNSHRLTKFPSTEPPTTA